MKLLCYPTVAAPPEIRAAPATRPWLDELPDSFGYRCLPLRIANAYGWEVLCASTFVAWWNGGVGRDALTIAALDIGADSPSSHFGSGVLTLHPGYLFRTEPGFDLFVTGPLNRPKDGIQPLAGVIETDWAPYSFTMNWRFSRANTKIRFEKGEPFCHLFPVKRGALEAVEPEIRDLAEDPETKQQFEAWSASRQNFIETLPTPGSPANQEGWQKNYYRGRLPDGGTGSPDHVTKLRLAEPVDKRATE